MNHSKLNVQLTDEEKKVTIRYNKHKWIMNKLLTETVYCKVYLLKKAKEESFAVMKSIKNTETFKERGKHEISIHKELNHKNIISFFDNGKCLKQDYILMAYATGGSLDRIKCDENKTRMYFQQLLDGVDYMHQKGIAHRDLKLSNLLVDFNKDLKICDFDSSERCNKDGLSKNSTTFGCSKAYRAPELNIADAIKMKELNLFKADIWSCGIILIELLTSQKPWEDSTERDERYRDWQKNNCDVRNVEPWKRLKAVDYDLISKIICISPNNRWSILQIKNHFLMSMDL